MVVISLALLSARCAASNEEDVVDTRERNILSELNELRSDPTAFAKKLEARRKFYTGNVLRLPKEVPLRTREGEAALDEAIRALRGRTALPQIEFSRALSRAARDHVRDVGKKGLVMHEGTDGSSPSERLKRYASDVGGVGEVISFGPEKAESVVIDLIVDDGVPDRGHRKILLDGRLRYAGIACGPHAIYRTMCVIDLADRLKERR
jgi:uncharacterized protein YkwD